MSRVSAFERFWPLAEEEEEFKYPERQSLPYIRTSHNGHFSNRNQNSSFPEWSIESAASSASKWEREVTIKRLSGPIRHAPFLPEKRRPPPRDDAEFKPAPLKADDAFNPDEERLIGALRIERKIKIPTAKGSKSRGNYIGSNPSDILTCSYTTNGNQLVTGCADGTVFIFSTVPGSLFGDMLHNFRKVSTLEAPSPLDACTRVRWHPKTNKDDENEVLLASYRRGFLRYWNTSDKYSQEKKNVATIQSEHEAPFQSFSVNPVEGDRVAIASENEILIYDDQTQRLIRKLKGDRGSDKRGDFHPLLSISQVKYHPTEAHVLVSGGLDRVVHIWDERVPRRSVRQIHGPCICGESMDIDENNLLAVGSWRRYDNVEIFDFGSGERIASIDQTPSMDLPILQPYVCRWQGKNGLIVGGSHSNGLKVIDRRDNCVISSMQNVPNPIVCIDQISKRPDCPVAAGAGSTIYFIKINWKQLETKE